MLKLHHWTWPNSLLNWSMHTGQRLIQKTSLHLLLVCPPPTYRSVLSGMCYVEWVCYILCRQFHICPGAAVWVEGDYRTVCGQGGCLPSTANCEAPAHLCTRVRVYVHRWCSWAQHEVNMYVRTYICSSPLLLQYLYCLCITICITSLVCVYIHNEKPSTECYKLHVHIQYISTVHT